MLPVAVKATAFPVAAAAEVALMVAEFGAHFLFVNQTVGV